MPKKVMVIAGEASGDLHGAGFVRELKKLDRTVEVFGVGGDKMKREGMELIYHIREVGFMGFFEVLKHLPFIRTMQLALEQVVKLKKPDVLVLIDYPGFNLRFAKIAKNYGVKIVYYISPQVWAWHKSRVKQMKGLIDSMLVVFPFEEKIYHDEGIDAEFVGHPLLEVLDSKLDRKDFCKRYGLDYEKKILALLPGSRKQEIDTIFPEMLRASRRVANEVGAEIVVGVAPTFQEDYFRTFFNVDRVTLVKDATYELMRNADFAFVTSGTATLETGCFGTPMFVVYKTSWPTYLMAKMFIQLKHIGLVNIVSQRSIVPEFVQHRATASILAKEAIKLLRDPARMNSMRSELASLKAKLGSIGASKRVAERVFAIA
jgi:lipid-A-disaccharide synthase